MCGDDTANTRGNQVENVAAGAARLDQNGRACHDSIDGLEASGFHGLSGFWKEQRDISLITWEWVQGLENNIFFFSPDAEHTDKIHDTVRDTQSACGLDTSADILDLGAQLGASLNTLELGEERLRQGGEAGHDVLTDQLLGLSDITLLWHLNLQLAATESKIKNFLNAGDFAGSQGCIVLGDLIATGDTEIDTALAYKGRNVGGRQEDESNGQVLNQGNVETGLTTELNVRPREEVKSGLLQATL